MLTKGMDREKAQMFLQQSIAQMCKVTVSFTGPIEIDGIICITGHHKDDLVLVRLHEKSTSPEVPDCGTDRQDDTSVTTHDLSMSTDAVTSVGYPHENLSENTICSSDDASCGHIRQLDSTSGVSGDRTWRYSKQFGDTCRSGNESCDYSTQVGDEVTGPEKRTEADTEHLNFVGTDDKIKTELIALDCDYENCIDEDVTDKSESCLHVDSSCGTIKKLSSDDFNPTKPDSKVMNHDEGGPCTVSHATRAMEFDESLLDLVSATRGVVSRVSGGQSACMRCSHCRDEFSTSSLLSMHMLNAHGVYACEHCQRCFMHHSSLHRHKHVHRDTLPWVCTLCQRGFQRKEHLSYHISCHNNMKLHQCGECGKGFKLRAPLHMHLDHVHAGRTQHLCKPCFMEFTNNATFTEHQKRHNDGSVSYLCGQCGYIGENRPSLIKHSVIHFGHKVDV